jgi:hypothetical protein
MSRFCWEALCHVSDHEDPAAGSSQMSGRRSRLRAGTGVLVAGVALTLVAGCASSGSGGAGSGSSSKSPIIIGGLAGTTGAYAAAGIATIDAAKLAVQQINAKASWAVR